MNTYEAVFIADDGGRTTVTTTADDRVAAKFEFAHGVYLDDQGHPMRGRIDYRSVKLLRVGVSHGHCHDLR